MEKKTLMAAALAGLILGAGVSAQDKPQEKGKCFGINACSGKSECAGAGHSCAGMNSCKGKGWVKMIEKDCKTKGGKWEKGTGM